MRFSVVGPALSQRDSFLPTLLPFSLSSSSSSSSAPLRLPSSSQFSFLPPLGLPPAAPLGFALLLLSARTGIDEAHIAACQACPPVSPGSVFSHDNIYRWGDRGDSRTQSDLVTLGMIYPPSTAMRFQRISPSDRLPPRALHHSCRHLLRGVGQHRRIPHHLHIYTMRHERES